MEDSKEWVCGVPGCSRHAGVEREGRMYCSFHHGTEPDQYDQITAAMAQYDAEIKLHDRAIRWSGRRRDHYFGDVKLYDYQTLIQMVHDKAQNIDPTAGRYRNINSDDGLWGQDRAAGE